MQTFPMTQAPLPTQPPVLVSRRRRRRFCWEIVWVLLAVVGAIWLIDRVPGPTFTWRDVMGALGVSRRGETAFTRTAVGGLVLIAVVYVVKVFRTK